MAFLKGAYWVPLLFLIYINDIGTIPGLIENPKLFADDTNIFVHSASHTDLNLRCQEVIDKISNWVSANRLTLNIDKTCYIIFNPHSSSPIPDLALSLAGSNIKGVLRHVTSPLIGSWRPRPPN